MELWEGAVLIVGGVWLVGYMSRRNAPANPALGAPAHAISPGGISNQSNLTTVTNQAGGAGTTWGEPLLPPQPNPITGKINPAWGANPPRNVVAVGVNPPSTVVPKPTPVGPVAPIRNLPVATPAPVNPRLRPMDMHLL